MAAVETAQRAATVVVYEPRCRRLKDKVYVHLVDPDGVRTTVAGLAWPDRTGAGFPVLLDRLDTDLARGYRRFVVDLHDVRFLSSSDIGHLIYAHQLAGEEHGRLVVARANRRVARVWTAMSLPAVIPLLTTVESAVAHLRGKP